MCVPAVIAGLAVWAHTFKKKKCLQNIPSWMVEQGHCQWVGAGVASGGCVWLVSVLLGGASQWCLGCWSVAAVAARHDCGKPWRSWEAGHQPTSPIPLVWPCRVVS